LKKKKNFCTYFAVENYWKIMKRKIFSSSKRKYLYILSLKIVGNYEKHNFFRNSLKIRTYITLESYWKIMEKNIFLYICSLLKYFHWKILWKKSFWKIVQKYLKNRKNKHKSSPISWHLILCRSKVTTILILILALDPPTEARSWSSFEKKNENKSLYIYWRL